MCRIICRVNEGRFKKLQILINDCMISSDVFRIEINLLLIILALLEQKFFWNYWKKI